MSTQIERPVFVKKNLFGRFKQKKTSTLSICKQNMSLQHGVVTALELNRASLILKMVRTSGMYGQLFFLSVAGWGHKTKSCMTERD